MSLPASARRFLAALGPAGAHTLHTALRNARHTPPADWVPWYCTDAAGHAPPQHVGVLSPERAALLLAHLPGSVMRPSGGTPSLHWQTLHHPEPQRSAALQHALEIWQQQGLVHGWRSEPFAFWAHDTEQPPEATPPLFQVERAGFRFLGMPSHAVHINGFTPEGRLWCGRRALSKATDPGMLDNVTAGGLPAGESPHRCALRELHEEAGAVIDDPARVVPTGTVRTARQDTGGWHEETLLVYHWDFPTGWQPANQDGEVAEFLCLHALEVLERIRAGAFTHDAVASLARGLGMTHEAATISPAFDNPHPAHPS